MAAIAIEAAAFARRLGYEPRVALLDFSTFGHPPGERSIRVKDAVRLLDERHVDFEYDGEMTADVTLNKEAMAQYPFCRLTDTANVLVMPAFHAASISTKMLLELGAPRSSARYWSAWTNRYRSSNSAARIPKSSIWGRSPPSIPTSDITIAPCRHLAAGLGLH